jgi:hypothetical protein
MVFTISACILLAVIAVFAGSMQSIITPMLASESVNRALHTPEYHVNSHVYLRRGLLPLRVFDKPLQGDFAEVKRRIAYRASEAGGFGPAWDTMTRQSCRG